jgi:hypothetical protein
MYTKFVPFTSARKTRLESQGFSSYVFFGERDVEGGGPQMYMNEVDPKVELAAHFHKVDQFQVFFGDPGARFARRQISPLTIHYTDAYSTYGPFNAAPDKPLLYATIRALSANYGGVMPGARDQLLYRGRRHFALPVEGWQVETLPESGDIESVVVSPRDVDGLAVALWRLGPGAEKETALVEGTSGRSYLVAAGDLTFEGQSFTSRTLGWSEPDGDPFVIAAGHRGCSVLVMDFPFPSTPAARARPASQAHI